MMHNKNIFFAASPWRLEKVIHKPTKSDKRSDWMVASGSTWYHHGLSIVFELLDRDMHVISHYV